MKLVTLSILISLTARAASLPPGFNPERWPGRMPPDKAGALQPLVKQLQEAQQKRDLPAMRRLVQDLSAKMGDYAGVPETKPEYAPLKKFDVPDAAKIAQLSRRSLEARNHTQRRRFSTAARPNKHDEFAVGRVKTEVRDGRDPAREYLGEAV